MLCRVDPSGAMELRGRIRVRMYDQTKLLRAIDICML